MGHSDAVLLCKLLLALRHNPAHRAQYDADQLPEAKCTLTKALHLAPTDHKLRFDVAVTMQACVLVGVTACHFALPQTWQWA